MALTNDQLLTRIEKIEEVLNETNVAVGNLVNKKQLNTVLLLLQKHISEAAQEIALLKARVQALEDA